MEWWEWLLLGWLTASVWTAILVCLWFKHVRRIEPDEMNGRRH